jgi:hypothetical protein
MNFLNETKLNPLQSSFLKFSDSGQTCESMLLYVGVISSKM